MHSEQEASPAFPKFARKCYQGWDHNPLQLRQLCRGLAERKGTRRQNIVQKRPRRGSRTRLQQARKCTSTRQGTNPARISVHEFPYTNFLTDVRTNFLTNLRTDFHTDVRTNFLQTGARISARIFHEFLHEFSHGFFTNFYTIFYTDFSRIFTRIFTRIFCERFTCRK